MRYRAHIYISSKSRSSHFITRWHHNAEVAARMYDVVSLRIRGAAGWKNAALNFPREDYDLDTVAQVAMPKAGCRLDESARSAILDLALSAHRGHPTLKSAKLAPTTPAAPDDEANTREQAAPGVFENSTGAAPGVDAPGVAAPGADTPIDEALQHASVTEAPQIGGQGVLAYLETRAFQEFCAQDALYPPGATLGDGSDADPKMLAIEPDRIREALEVWRRALLLEEAPAAQSAAETFRACVTTALCSARTDPAHEPHPGGAGTAAADISDQGRTVTLLTLMWVLDDALLSAADADAPVKLAFLDRGSSLPSLLELEPHALPRATALKTALHRSLVITVCCEAAEVPECGLHLMLRAAEALLNNMQQLARACEDGAVCDKEDWCLWLISLLRLLTPPFCSVLERYARSATTAAADPFESRDKVRSVLAACLAIDPLARSGGLGRMPALHPVIFLEWGATWAPIRTTVRNELLSAQMPLSRDVQSLLLLRTDV